MVVVWVSYRGEWLSCGCLIGVNGCRVGVLWMTYAGVLHFRRSERKAKHEEIRRKYGKWISLVNGGPCVVLYHAGSYDNI